MNPNVPITIFLPPLELQNIHLLVTDDPYKLDSGVFPLRVHKWSVELLSSIISYDTFRHNESEAPDRSILGEVLKDRHFKDNVAHLPHRWFNAVDSHEYGTVDETMEGDNLRQGDLLVHVAGVENSAPRLHYFMNIAQQHLPEWEMHFANTSYPAEMRDFWARYHAENRVKGEQLHNATDATEQMIDKVGTLLESLGDELDGDQNVEIKKKAAKTKKVLDEEGKELEKIIKAKEELQMVKPFCHSRRGRAKVLTMPRGRWQPVPSR